MQAGAITPWEARMRAVALAPLIGLFPAVALAAPLDLMMETWAVERDGAGVSSGRSEARGLAIDPNGEVVVVGWLGGGPDHGDDGWLARFDLTGTPVFEVLLDEGPFDRLFDVALGGAGSIAVAGALSGTAETFETSFYTARFDSDGELTWESHFQDGSGSHLQAAHAVAVDPTTQRVVSAGWSWRSPAIAGQWLLRRVSGSTGNLHTGPVYHNAGTEPFAPDQAYDVAVHTDSSVVVVGAVGIDGGTDATDADRDWLVRKLDPTMQVVEWEHQWSGPGGLEDAARAVLLDGAGNLVVVGSTNAGADNGDGAAHDWLVIKYNGTTGAVIWETQWTSGPGADDRAYAVALDTTGNLIVGGTWSDGGVSAWRIARLSNYDGAELGEMRWSAGPADSVLHDLDVWNQRIALVGTEGTSDGAVATVRVLDRDSDGDGVPDLLEECPFDPEKLEPGICGCGQPDVDTDGDGVYDCHDACPLLPEKWEDPGVCGCHRPDTDRDGDGVPDCIDECPDDPDKSEMGECGCGNSDEDPDGDGVPLCRDACPNTPPGAEVDERGCAPGEGGLPDDEDIPQDPAQQGSGGCGCATSSPPAGWLLVLAGGLLARRRRRAPRLR